MLIFGVVYMLWMYKCVYFGVVVNDYVVKLKDIGCCEFLMLVVFVVFMLLMGLYLKFFIDVMYVFVENFFFYVV